MRIKRTKHRVKLAPTPRCCKQMRDSRLVTLCLDPKVFTEIQDQMWTEHRKHRGKVDPQVLLDKIAKAKPQWMVSDYFTSRRRGSSFDNRASVVVQGCPFCGVGVPGFRQKKTLPDPLCIPDGNYCLTCSKRLDSCFCSNPMSAFEPADR